MKRTMLSFSALLISSIVFAQAPDAFKYQAVVRDNSGNLITEQSVGIQIEILKGATDGTSVYTETHTVTTNAYGLVNLEIGSGTSTDDLATVNWGDDDYFIQVSLDATGGTFYELMGTSQLLSVPYALHSSVADSVVQESQTLAIDGNTLSISDGNSVELPSGGSSGGLQTLVLSGDISDSEAATKIQNEVGSNTIFILVTNTSKLTTLDFSGITFLVEIEIVSNASLSSVSFPDLEAVSKETKIQYNPLLSSVNFDKLVNTPKLEFGSNAFTSLILPLFEDCQYFAVYRHPALTDIQVPVLTNFGSPTYPYKIFSVQQNALPSVKIDQFLAQFASIDPPISGVDILLDMQTPPARPSAQGIIDRGTLQSNGNYLQTD